MRRLKREIERQMKAYSKRRRIRREEEEKE